jgi:Skp family chaperone for outer membrane proteins
MEQHMRRGIRWSIATAAVAGAVGAGLGVGAAGARGSRHGGEPAPARIAVCDVYGLLDSLVQSDRYQPQIRSESEKAQADLEPLARALQDLQETLRGMQERLKGMSPQDEEAQRYYREYQEKEREFQERQREFQERQRRARGVIERLVAGSYLDGYKQVKASAEAVARDLGYTHVIASRNREEVIKTEDPNQIIQAFLARPVVVMPEGTDITEDVKKDLKLD